MRRERHIPLIEYDAVNFDESIFGSLIDHHVVGDDGRAGVADLIVLLGNWGAGNCEHPEPFVASGDVDVIKLLELIVNWGVGTR